MDKYGTGELGFEVGQPVSFWCDNEGEIKIAENPISDEEPSISKWTGISHNSKLRTLESRYNSFETNYNQQRS